MRGAIIVVEEPDYGYGLSSTYFLTASKTSIARAQQLRESQLAPLLQIWTLNSKSLEPLASPGLHY